jgi:hypothetical protein
MNNLARTPCPSQDIFKEKPVFERGAVVNKDHTLILPQNRNQGKRTIPAPFREVLNGNADGLILGRAPGESPGL